uniref:Uncharacterized protein n=1 Tax=Arundo donax TaxID=35708 RepID=A0A0A9BYG1_ARUDO
MAMLRDAAA